MVSTFLRIIDGIKAIYPLEHIPLFRFKEWGKEKFYFDKVLQENNVTTSGQLVSEVEQRIQNFTSAKHAIATTSGTSALHAALHAIHCDADCEVITQAFTFVATANAILYTGAQPVFLGSDRDCIGLSPKALQQFLEENCSIKEDGTYNTTTNKKIKACIAVHIFGYACKMDELKAICTKYKIVLIEDAAQAYGSYYKNRHLGTIGDIGIFSFNGSKVVSAGMGGAIVTNDDSLAEKCNHLTRIATIKSNGQSAYDQMGFNYRMSNLNAALLLAQLDFIDDILQSKEKLHNSYAKIFKELGVDFLCEIEGCKPNYWLNHFIIESPIERDKFLQLADDANIECRPAWTLLNDNNYLSNYQSDSLEHARHFQNRIVLLPSGLV